MWDCPSVSMLTDDEEVCDSYAMALEKYKNGIFEEARMLLEPNVSKGCDSSMVLLGIILSEGSKEDKVRSIKLFEESSDMGNAFGIANLAYCYATGTNVEKDLTTAFEFYTEAAGMGNAEAACDVGDMYRYGDGVGQDAESSYYWYARSARGGSDRGMANLGLCYLRGIGVEKTVPLAVRWFEKTELSDIYLSAARIETGTPEERESALKCLKEATDSGCPEACVLYGLYLNNEKTADYMTVAASKGNREAAEYLRKE